MNNLSKFEFRKLFRQKSFYICTAVMLALSFVGLLLNKIFAENTDFNTASVFDKTERRTILFKTLRSLR